MWHKISEKVPPFNTDVLLKFGGVFGLSYEVARFNKDACTIDTIYNTFENGDFTEWMEIPE